MAFGLFLGGILWTFVPGIGGHFALPKFLALCAATAVLAVVWLIRTKTHPPRPLPKSVALSLLALVAWALVSAVFALHRPTAWFGYHDRHNGLLTLGLLACTFAMLASWPATRQDLLRWLRVFPIVVVPVAVYALVQFVGLDPLELVHERPPSSIGHPVSLAAVLSLAVPLAAAQMQSAGTRISTAVWAAVLVVLVLGIGATLSRGPWVGLAVGAVVYAVLVGRAGAGARPRQWHTVGFAAAVIVVAGALVVGLSPDRQGQILQRVSELWGARGAPLSARLVFFRAAVEMALDHPLAGVGLENFAVAYPRYRPAEGVVVGPDVVPTMVHNGYLQWAATTGWPGLGCYLALLAALAWTLLRGLRSCPAGPERLIAAGFVASLTTFVVQDLTGWPDIALSATVWSMAGLGLSWVAVEEAPSPPGAPGGWPRGVGLVAPVLSVTGLAIAIPSFLVERQLSLASRLDPVAQWAQLSPLLSEVERRGTAASHLDRVGLLFMRRTTAAADSEALHRAAAAFDAAHRLNPHDVYVVVHRLDLDTVGRQLGLVGEADPTLRELASRLAGLDPNNATVHRAVAANQLAAGQAKEAVAAIRQAVALRPTLPEPRLLEGDISRAVGDHAGAAESYRQAIGLSPQGSESRVSARRRLALLLVEAGDLAGARHEADESMRERRADALTLTTSAAVYEAAGEVDGARRLLEEALREEPGYRLALEALARLSTR